MSHHERRALIVRTHPTISIARQADLLNISRASVYYQPTPVSSETIALMHRIDELYTAHPFLGSPRITALLKSEGRLVNHKRVERLMRTIGLAAIYPKRRATTPHPGHIVYPYLLRGMPITHPNHVLGTDIAYIRLSEGFAYLVAVIDWFSRYVIAWELSASLESEFCLAALHGALIVAKPDIHNSDQGSQFTDEEYVDVLKNHGIRISMDGRGRCMDNIFTERLWRSVKYEDVYLKGYRNITDARYGLREYFTFYNTKRPHQSLQYQTPADIYFGTQRY